MSKLPNNSSQITCRDCGTTFTWTKGEQEWFAARGFRRPVRCCACRELVQHERRTGPDVIEHRAGGKPIPHFYGES